ncbi:MAG: glycosyltransferase [Bacteroides sp.]|nr:glycosyltransferase [Bacteroides sp.]
MKETDLAAVVVLYHPPLGELRKNILSCIDEVEILVLTDNSETMNPEIAELAEKWEKMVYISMQGNQGIAKALNRGINYCLEKGFSWILTMDQDSRFLTSLKGYKEYISNQDSRNIAILCPTYSIEGESQPTPATAPYPLRKVIQSGNLIQGEVFRKLGGYQEKYFIDYIDYEYCMRSRKNWITIYYAFRK